MNASTPQTKFPGLAAKIALVILLCVGSAACSHKQKEQYVAGEVGTLYNRGKTYLDRKDYENAAKYFNAVEQQHPYTDWARRAQLMAAYSQYMNNDYEEAILSAQRFLTLHPGNASAPYAWYLIAVCYYEQITDVGRDQKVTENAMNAFRQVVARFPNTPYARDAQLKLDLTRDHLAGKEMAVGRFYQKEKNYLAALLRFRTVIDDYQTTTHVPEALERLVEVYLALGLKDEAVEVASVLGHNYPKSKWYKYSYALLTNQKLTDDIPKKHKKFLGLF